MADGKKIKTKITNSGLGLPAPIRRETVIVDDLELELNTEVELTQEQIDRLKDAGVEFEDSFTQPTTSGIQSGGETQ